MKLDLIRLPPIAAKQPRAVLTFVPPGQTTPPENQRAYEVRAPDYFSHAAAEREYMPFAAQVPNDADIARAAMAAAENLLDADSKEKAIPAFRSYIAWLTNASTDPPIEAASIVREAQELLLPRSPEMLELVAQRHYAMNMIRFISVRHHVLGWRNMAVPYAVGPDGLVTEDALGRLPTTDIALLAHFILEAALMPTPSANTVGKP
jgi:hypothetical protein